LQRTGSCIKLVDTSVCPDDGGGREATRVRRAAIIALGLLLAVCVISAIGGLVYLLWPGGVTRPVVLISAPGQGEEVRVGEAVAIYAVARDQAKVARLELWVDGELQHAQTTAMPDGISPFPLAASWEPLSPGAHTLTVRGFNLQGGRGQASIIVEAIEEADRDGDGVRDDDDACPDEPGSRTAEGCPDRDRDSIPDAEDACPDEAGLAERDGCPAPGDLDSDGILDGEDACPEMPGLPEDAGCPPSGGGGEDADEDGIPDAEDLCPDEPGSLELAGCPDRDGDDVLDAEDLCPDEAGPPENRGCPDTGTGDRDDDTVPDDVDVFCPDEPGLPEDAGCPPPGGGEDADDDGIPDDLEGPADFLGGVDFSLFMESYTRMELPVEFQALELEVDSDYDQVWCYASLAGGAMEHHGPFDPLGERRWDIAAYLGGASSRHVRVPSGEPLQVQAECLASVSGEDEPYHLGEISGLYSASDWDGHVITVDSRGGDEGRAFRVSYRVCSPSCEEAAFPPPILSLLHSGRDYRLLWTWSGDRESIDGFTVYLNDTYLFDLPADRRSQSIGYLEPLCGERMEFEMTAYSGRTFPADRESPRSNTVYWEGEVCPRTVRVTFERLTTHGYIGEDEYTGPLYDLSGGPNAQGPILGNFWASSSSDHEVISFDGAYCYYYVVAQCRGIDLEPSSEMRIQEDILDPIRTYYERLEEEGGSLAPYFDAPDHNYVIVDLGAEDNLTIRGRIKDDDYWTHEDTLFDVELELRPEQVVSGPVTLSGHHMDLTVMIEVLESP
jgi:hypothetical protein